MREGYGAAAFGGAYDRGAIYQLTPSGSGWMEQDLHDFTGGADGSIPWGAVVLDANGNLYGTTYSGGAHGDGVVWEITP